MNLYRFVLTIFYVLTGDDSILRRRKLIGVIISEVEGLYQHKLLKGIISECYSLNYDVAIFSTLIRDTGLPEYKIGEKNIYNLINFEQFDGILVAPMTFAIENLQQEIETMLRKKCKCPVLYIDYNSEHFPSVYTNDSISTEEITDHLIDFHGYKEIYCLAARPNVISTNQRVKGFKNSLIKHHMPVDENKIFYSGDFWYTSGEKFAKKIINKEIEMPEAVVCISDYMAIGLVNELMKHGIRVPEDISVTGFDASDEASSSMPSITTFSPSIFQAGMEAVCELTRLMTGVKFKPSKTNPGSFEKGHSCGCSDVDYVKRTGVFRLRKKVDDYKELLDSYMTEALTTTISFEECIKKLYYFLYLIKDYSDYFLCLCENWDGSDDVYSLDSKEYPTIGYTDRMKLVMACENKKLVKSDYYFNTKDMVPDLWKDRKSPKAYYFTPLHFNERCIGYSVLSYGDTIKACDITYRNWSRIIMNSLEYCRINRKLYLSSFRDVLTGIYNRNGLNQNLSSIIDEATDQNFMVMAVMTDLDNLKAINDRYGHNEGDNIIKVVANAIQSCCSRNEICARTGGDEFLVIGCDQYTDEMVDSFVANVDGYIDYYNKTSKKPYEIEISIGSYYDYISDTSELKDIIDQADKVMYTNKVLNKRIYR